MQTQNYHENMDSKNQETPHAAKIYRPEEGESSLVSKNITVLGRRTSVRLEPEMWKALNDIAKREQSTIHDLCSVISLCKKQYATLTASIRTFLMLYYKAASTEEGHMNAGHGNLLKMKERVGL